MNRWSVAADLLDPPALRYREDPATWARDRLRVHLWSKQVEVLEGLVGGDVAVHSCHGVGKSFAAATAVCWWLDVHPPGEAFVVSTAPTGDQVKAILWREVNRLHERGGLAGRTNLTEWYVGSEIVAMGRKPNDYRPEAFQGIHARYVLVVYDEACGIPQQLWDAGSTLTLNDASRQLAIGNPDDPHGHFARVCAPGSGWRVVHVGYADAPNFTGEVVPEVISESTIGRHWVEQKALEWGEGSALYTSKVLGLFPVDADSGVIPGSMVARCRYLDGEPGLPVEAGLDFGASEGGDRTVLRERRGRRVGRVARWSEADPMKLVGDVALHLAEWGVERVKVDSTGVGWGVAGRLDELSTHRDPQGGAHGAEVVRVNFAERASDPQRWLNRRAELWWNGRELSRLETWDLTGLEDHVVAELTAPRYEIVDSSGKVKIEKKDEVRKRLGRSPDDADALLLAYFVAGGPVTVHAREILRATIPGVSGRAGIRT